MKFTKYCFLFYFFLISSSWGGETSYSLNGTSNLLYGYSDVSSPYEALDKNNNYVGTVRLNSSVEHDFNSDYRFSLYFDLMAGSGLELQNYTNGSWGKEIYGVFETPFGQFVAGESLNAAAQLQAETPAYGPLGINNSSIVDFIKNPNWQRRNHGYTSFQTLNSTAMNTDGVAPKISYYSPQFANTIFAFSYVPDTYSRTGLINKFAHYARKDAYIAALYNETDLGFADLVTSLGYGIYQKNDKDLTASLALYRGNWSLGASYRKTYVDGNDYSITHNSQNIKLPDFFDNYREGQAWSAGIGYRFGPLKTSLSYFESQADNTRNKDEIIMFANDFQINKYLNLYAIAAHVNFRGIDSSCYDNNKGYAFVTGFGINF